MLTNFLAQHIQFVARSIELQQKAFEIGAFGQIGMYRMVGPSTAGVQDTTAAARISKPASHGFGEHGVINVIRTRSNEQQPIHRDQAGREPH